MNVWLFYKKNNFNFNFKLKNYFIFINYNVIIRKEVIVGILKRPEFIFYEDALEGFTSARKKLNDLIEKEKYDEFLQLFKDYKMKASVGDTVAMDTIAYYYKSGVSNVLGENYPKYLSWEIMAASRGNELAIEKLQFLFTYAYEQIMDCDNYEDIEYKNDIDEYNALYIIGKAICKVLLKEMNIFLLDLANEEDKTVPFNKDIFNKFRKTVDDSIPKVIKFLS